MDNEVNQGFDVTRTPAPQPISQESTPEAPAQNATLDPSPEVCVLEGPPKNTVSRGSAITAMVLGIVSILAAELTIIGSIAAIVLGLIAKGKGKDILDSDPESNATRAFARVGKITGLVGFILGIVFLVFSAISFVAGFIFSLMGMAAAPILDQLFTSFFEALFNSLG